MILQKIMVFMTGKEIKVKNFVTGGEIKVFDDEIDFQLMDLIMVSWYYHLIPYPFDHG